MTKSQEYEQAVLHGMFMYKDTRPLGYLNALNFRHKTCGIENSNIFNVFSKSLVNSEIISELNEQNEHLVYTLTQHKGYLSDVLGVNTPKYCLLILENVFQDSIIKTLKSLVVKSPLYMPIVQNVLDGIEPKMDCFELCNNILSYFRIINFEAGVLTFEDLAASIDERIKRINQNYEIDMLYSRLKRYCEDANRNDYVEYLEKIKTGIKA